MVQVDGVWWRTYVVRRDDWLSRIAEREMGEAAHWTDIRAEDGSALTDVSIVPGQILLLPVNPPGPSSTAPDTENNGALADVVQVYTAELSRAGAVARSLAEPPLPRLSAVAEHARTLATARDRVDGLQSGDQVGLPDSRFRLDSVSGLAAQVSTAADLLGTRHSSSAIVVRPLTGQVAMIRRVANVLPPIAPSPAFTVGDHAEDLGLARLAVMPPPPSLMTRVVTLISGVARGVANGAGGAVAVAAGAVAVPVGAVAAIPPIVSLATIVVAAAGAFGLWRFQKLRPDRELRTRQRQFRRRSGSASDAARIVRAVTALFATQRISARVAVIEVLDGGYGLFVQCDLGVEDRLIAESARLAHILDTPIITTPGVGDALTTMFVGPPPDSFPDHLSGGRAVLIPAGTRERDSSRSVFINLLGVGAVELSGAVLGRQPLLRDYIAVLRNTMPADYLLWADDATTNFVGGLPVEVDVLLASEGHHGCLILTADGDPATQSLARRLADNAHGRMQIIVTTSSPNNLWSDARIMLEPPHTLSGSLPSVDEGFFRDDDDDRQPRHSSGSIVAQIGNVEFRLKRLAAHVEPGALPKMFDGAPMPATWSVPDADESADWNDSGMPSSAATTSDYDVAEIFPVPDDAVVSGMGAAAARPAGGSHLLVDNPGLSLVVPPAGEDEDSSDPNPPKSPTPNTPDTATRRRASADELVNQGGTTDSPAAEQATVTSPDEVDADPAPDEKPDDSVAQDASTDQGGATDSLAAEQATVTSPDEVDADPAPDEKPDDSVAQDASTDQGGASDPPAAEQAIVTSPDEVDADPAPDEKPDDSVAQDASTDQPGTTDSPAAEQATVTSPDEVDADPAPDEAPDDSVAQDASTDQPATTDSPAAEQAIVTSPDEVDADPAPDEKPDDSVAQDASTDQGGASDSPAAEQATVTSPDEVDADPAPDEKPDDSVAQDASTDQGGASDSPAAEQVTVTSPDTTVADPALDEAPDDSVAQDASTDQGGASDSPAAEQATVASPDEVDADPAPDEKPDDSVAQEASTDQPADQGGTTDSPAAEQVTVTSPDTTVADPALDEAPDDSVAQDVATNQSGPDDGSHRPASEYSPEQIPFAPVLLDAPERLSLTVPVAEDEPPRDPPVAATPHSAEAPDGAEATVLERAMHAVSDNPADLTWVDTPLRVGILGPFLFAPQRDDRSYKHVNVARRASELLSFLLVGQMIHGARVPRDAVRDALWPDVRIPAAKKSLRASIWQLHADMRAHASDAFDSDNGTIWLLSDTVASDIETLMTLRRRARGCADQGNAEQALDMWTAAAALIRGPVLDGFDAEWAADARKVIIPLVQEIVSAASPVAIELGRPVAPFVTAASHVGTVAS